MTITDNIFKVEIPFSKIISKNRRDEQLPELVFNALNEKGMLLIDVVQTDKEIIYKVYIDTRTENN